MLFHDLLESRLCLSSIALLPHDIVSPSKVDGARSVYAADVDGDGDLDFLSASSVDNKIAWYENTNGKGAFGSQQVISTKAKSPQSVYAADVDDDGDIDILSASSGDGKIAWYENRDGQGRFGPQQVITIQASRSGSVHAADVDGDGDLDVLSASYRYRVDSRIAWYENTDGQGTFGPQQVITSQADVSRSVYATDLDGDGDVDVLSASSHDAKIAWYENTDGQGAFGSQKVITTEALGAQSVHAADLDGDGDMDVLSASSVDQKIAWYENSDGQGAFGPAQVIMTSVLRVDSVYAADLDGDGDLDVLSASELGHQLFWSENTDGHGAFGPQHVTGGSHGTGAVYAADLDGDGDIDVLSASFHDDKILWFENRVVGDSNNDGVFDSGDLVRVFQVGEYQDDKAKNSTYDEGDWNGDGDFSTADLVFAFQAGTYVMPATLGSAEISAAVDWLFADRQKEQRSSSESLWAS